MSMLIRLPLPQCFCPRGRKLRPWSEKNSDQNSDHPRLCIHRGKENLRPWSEFLGRENSDHGLSFGCSWGRGRRGGSQSCQQHFLQELSCDPNPQYFLKSAAAQMGGVLPSKWEAYCWVSLSSRLRSQEGAAIQMGGILPYKSEVYCSTFQTSCTGWGLLNSPHLWDPFHHSQGQFSLNVKKSEKVSKWVPGASRPRGVKMSERN